MDTDDRMDTDIEGAESARQHWVQHPYTEKLARDAQKQTAAALDALIKQCRTSSDPKVLEKYFAYTQWKALELVTTRGVVQ